MKQSMAGRCPLRHMCFLVLLWLWDNSLRSDGGEIRPIPTLPTVNFSRPGNLTFGVVMSLHEYDPSSLCGNTTRELGALQRLESIAFAVKEINSRSDLLPGLTLGFTVLDDCFNELTALSRALQFIQNTEDDVTVGNDTLPSVSAVAVIGAEGSPRTLQMADMFSVFHVPLLSYASSSALLDDRTKYSYFSRIVPSDNMQAKAIVDILLSFGWTYVSILYTAGSYGTEGFRAIQTHLEAKGYCLAITHMLKNSFTQADYEATVRKLLTIPQARVVVLFTTQTQALHLFKTLKSMGHQDSFSWVGGDSIAMNPHTFKGLERVVQGTLSVNFLSSPVERFEEHFQNMTLRTGSRNPWFGEFVSAAFGCSLEKNASDACDEDKMIGTAPTYKPESTTSLSMNGVYALAHALDAVTRNCTFHDVSACVTPQLLRDTLRKVHFQGEGANISFDANGNGQMSYEIRNLVMDAQGSLMLDTVGMWDTATQSFAYFNKDQIRWKKGLVGSSSGQTPTKTGTNTYPVSVCSLPCRKGQQAITTQPPCCFYCENCRANERTVMQKNRKKCEICPTDSNFTWPDDMTRTECLPLTPSFLDFHVLEGILIFTFDLVIFAFTCIIAFFYVKNGHSRLIKASSQELCIMMMVGHVLTCLLIVTFVLEPSTVTCVVTNAGFHLSFTLTYSPLLVKTNRIFRIFVAGHRTTKKPLFISSKAQVVFATIIISLQLTLTCISMGVDPPKVQTIMPSLSERQVNRECSVPQGAFLASISFNIILMALCAGHAFKTRDLPANFNEAKFITFSIYTTILLWLSFFPTYFTATQYKVKALCLAVALMFNVLSCQIFLFLPKLYALYFVSEDEMDVRDNMRPSSIAPAS